MHLKTMDRFLSTLMLHILTYIHIMQICDLRLHLFYSYYKGKYYNNENSVWVRLFVLYSINVVVMMIPS